MDTSKYKALYIQETTSHLGGIEKGLLALEKGHDQAAVDELFRHYHSVKGMSASMGYEPMKKLSHSQENLLDAIRSKKIGLTPEIVTTLLQCLDAMRSMLELIEKDLPLDADISALLSVLEALRTGSARHAEPVADKAAPKAKPAAQEIRISNVMTVEARVFDDLLSIVGDLLSELSSFRTLSHSSRSIALKDNVHNLGRSVDSLYGNILSARMLPIKDLTEALPRVIRDMCLTSGKEIELTVDDAGISLDRSVLQALAGPMVHIIRNAVDHGIETPDERINCGKEPKGRITITAYSKKDHAVIEVSDDGKGIDPERLKIEAMARGLDREKAVAMSEKEALMLICMPGLSTAAKVTETSGRGVGMDAVKDAIEGLGGSISVASAQGTGTSITLELPRSTSIIKALSVSVGHEIFLIPISRVERVLEVPAHSVKAGKVEYDGRDIEVRQLASAVGMEEAHERKAAPSTVIIVRSPASADASRERLMGFAVDDFGEEIDAYVRPLVPPMARLKGVLGITVMEEARPVFLLDMAQLASRQTQRTGTA